MKPLRYLLLLAAIVLASPHAQAADKLTVVASFSILGDMARAIGGDDVAVTTLVGPDTDTHAYNPRPADAKTLAHARLVIVNGLGFEGWIDRLIQSSGFKGSLVTASTGVAAHEMDENGASVTDPHAWQDVSNGRIYARNIAEALATALPDRADAIRARAKTYDDQLATLDRWIKTEMAGIPEVDRKIITSHDAFGYFGAAYGVRLLATEGVSAEAEPGAATIARLIDQIRAEHITTLFVETMANPRLVQQISRETGAKLGAPLYSDALSAPDGPAATYIDMFRYNVPLMTQAMKAKP